VIGFDADGVQVPRTGRPYRYVVALKGVAADEARFERGWPRFHLESLGRIERRNAEKADLVIVPSEYSARVVADLYRVEPERISVVPEAIHAEPWEELRSQPPTRTDHRPTVLTVGRQYPRKNTARLIHAMARVRSEIPDVRLRVIGGGPCLPDLRALSEQLGLQDSVELDGAVGSSSEVHRAYFEADMFAMPSLQEGFGIVYLEAMAAGIPVLAGRAGAAPEVIVDGQTGLLCDPLDPETIAEGIIGLLSSPTERTRMGEHGIERAGLFTPTAIAGRFLERMATL